jgi:hypothetical protein
MARVAAQVPYALQEAVVQACGTVFWYKRPLKALLVRAGVPAALVRKYEDASKFIMVREILAELDARGDGGIRVQHQLVRELAAMRTVADPDNQEAGLKALEELRQVARDVGVIEKEQAKESARDERRRSAQQKQELIAARSKGLGELHARYMELALNPDGAQQRGYDLQDLLEGYSSSTTSHISRHTERGRSTKRMASSPSVASTTCSRRDGGRPSRRSEICERSLGKSKPRSKALEGSSFLSPDSGRRSSTRPRRFRT